MNSTIQALQGLYVKMGGNLTDTYSTIADGIPVSDYVTIPDMIEACTQKAGSGGGSGSDLPAVTSDDNGSVLTVVEGEWDKAVPSGGVLVVTMSGTPLTSDKTWQEIYNAVKGGKVAIINTIDESEGYSVTTQIIWEVDGDNSGYFIYCWDFGNDEFSAYATDTADGYPQDQGIA